MKEKPEIRKSTSDWLKRRFEEFFDIPVDGNLEELINAGVAYLAEYKRSHRRAR